MQDSQDLKVCDNCKKQFPSEKIDLHEAYCFRNIKKCPKCAEMIDINEMEAHDAEFHTKKVCQQCQGEFSPEEFAAHPDACPRKLVHCQFCQNSYAQVEIEKHKTSCGSRTQPCSICQRLIMIKDLAGHQQRCLKRREERRQERRQESTEVVPHERIRNLNRHQSQRERQISQKGRERVPSVQKNVITKPHKIKPSHMIGPETIKPMIDPVPISIRMAMKAREQQRVPLKSKN